MRGGRGKIELFFSAGNVNDVKRFAKVSKSSNLRDLNICKDLKTFCIKHCLYFKDLQT